MPRLPIMLNGLPATHLTPLELLGDVFGVSKQVVENAECLASGRPDLVVLLLEPSNKADYVSYEDEKERPTLIFVDEYLRKFGTNIDETIVLDMRPFRPKVQRCLEFQKSEKLCLQNDEMAYACTGGILAILQPKVILVCQCQTGNANEEFARILCSSTGRDGLNGKVKDVSLLINGSLPYKPTVVYSFHPMWALYEEEEDLYNARCEQFERNMGLAFRSLHEKLESPDSTAAGLSDQIQSLGL